VTPPPASRPPLDPHRATVPGWRVEVLPRSPSTNAEVAARARAGEPAGLVLATEHQTAGRGRLDRAWVTPAGAALTFSVLLRPEGVPVARWPWLPLLTGVAVVDAVRAATGLEAALKWPNDVLLPDDASGSGGGKVAGILVERVEAGPEAAAVVGVGLNVTTTREELPVDTATPLALGGAADLDRSALLSEVLASFSARYDGWVSAAGRGLRPAYVAVCSTLGREVRVDLPAGGTLRGRAVDVDEDGRLLVDDGARVHALGAGDVVHVRPEPLR
jgi:BirA family transcriptional regulator, biotin operon repressor / biotin---[acetyl-CoA-carboxylase] ligase